MLSAEDELARVPLQTINKSRWPKNVRPIALKESDGLGIDIDGRLYWDGKPVEIIGRRLDLTWSQFWIALVVATFTVVAVSELRLKGGPHITIGPAEISNRPF